MKNKRLLITVVAAGLAICSAASAIQTGGRPHALIATGLGDYGGRIIEKVCDRGRAIYVVSGPYGDSGSAIAVVDADECKFR